MDTNQIKPKAIPACVLPATDKHTKDAMLQQFTDARRVSTPLLAITTPDPAATITTLRSVQDATTPAFEWDVVRGLVACDGSEQADEVLRSLPDFNPVMYTNPVAVLELVIAFPENSIVFLKNAHRIIDDMSVCQALWNVRDKLKENWRSVVLLAPEVKLPVEIANDVVVLDEPLPDANQLGEIVREAFAGVQLPEPEPAVLQRAVDAISGLAAFPAEQVVSVSMTPTHIDIQKLWEKKRQQIEQTPGLQVWRGGERFEDIAGLQNIKNFLGKVIRGNCPPNVIVFIDEVEKALAGSGGGGRGGDSSGVAQDQLLTLLTEMEDTKSTGIICTGVPGTSKSTIAKACGNEAEVITIKLDLGAMKGSLVGESERRLRSALKVIRAVAQGRALYIATCNGMAILPPEYQRRFTLGTFFFDVPTASERAAIWSMYLQAYGLQGLSPAACSTAVNDTGWTGAEIKQCCDLAWRMDCSIAEAGQLVVPVIERTRETIEELRRNAHGRYISASEPGKYRYTELTKTGTFMAEQAAKRGISLN